MIPYGLGEDKVDLRGYRNKWIRTKKGEECLGSKVEHQPKP